MHSWWAEVAALAVLMAHTAAGPRRLPEAVVAVPGALLLCALGVVGWRQASEELATMGPTVAFLAAVLRLGQMCRRDGLFEAAGALMARHARGSGTRLLALVTTVATLVTATLSLDATVVLLTPVVVATTARLKAPARPHLHATAHLANTASLLLPVSNLTNLLVLGRADISFTRFAALMAAPFVVAVTVEFLAVRLVFAADLREPFAEPDRTSTGPVPRFTLVTLALALAGFAVASWVGIEPVVVATAGMVVLALRQVARGAQSPMAVVGDLVRAANPSFLIFVLALAVVVRGVVDHGLGSALGAVPPSTVSLAGLLAMALVAAVVANLINNLPAVLVLGPLVAPAGPVAVLAVLIGVNVGPNLTYMGSLATLLWRRIATAHGAPPRLGRFTGLGLVSVPTCLLLCPAALWASANLMGAHLPLV